MTIEEYVPLGPLTTMKVGGPARYFLCAYNISDITDAIVFAKEKALPLFVLGGGSNLLVCDEGYDGVVHRHIYC
jgi:UDP-N-acetylmuramate dehydrogenase